MKPRTLHLFLPLLLAAALAPTAGQAQVYKQPNGYTWGELSLLPEYCKDVQGVLYGDSTSPSPRAAEWVGIMGQDFWHMHHYCRALVLVQRSQAAGLGQNTKANLYDRAQVDYEYTIRNASAATPLMPEVLLRYGELLLLRNNMEGAGEAFEQARQLKPDYWPAYTRWIDVLMGLKRYDTARALAETGLQNAPGNPELQRRLDAIKRPGSVHAANAGGGKKAAAVMPQGAASAAAAAASAPPAN